MKLRSPIAGLLLLALSAGFVALWQLQLRIDTRRAELHQERDELELSSGKLLKAMSLEYAPLMADIYWTRTVQYYGDKRAHEDPNFDLLWPLLDITTTLDPQLIVAYRFGSTFLSEPPARGAKRPILATLRRPGIHLLLRCERLSQSLGGVSRRQQEASRAGLDEDSSSEGGRARGITRDVGVSLERTL
jgi:hypothetical protein